MYRILYIPDGEYLYDLWPPYAQSERAGRWPPGRASGLCAGQPTNPFYKELKFKNKETAEAIINSLEDSGCWVRTLGSNIFNKIIPVKTEFTVVYIEE